MFVQISQSIVVNKAKIQTIEGDKVILENGEELHVSRIYRNALRDLSMDNKEHASSESIE